MDLFKITTVVVTILGYPISFIELIGTLFGFASVYYASKANILTWPTGIINIIFLFILFYQVHLYADMILQIFFLITTLIGWFNWKGKVVKKTITNLSTSLKGFIIVSILYFTYLLGHEFISTMHIWGKAYFPTPASFPYIDTFIMVGSIFATILLIKRKIENWCIWIIVDVVATILYFYKGIYFLSLEYLLFTGLATYGLLNWQKEQKLI